MDVQKYKCPLPVVYSDSEISLKLSVLPQSKIELAERNARLRVDKDERYAALEKFIQILAIAGDDVPSRWVRNLYPEQVYRAYAAWLDNQAEHTPDADKLAKYFAWAVYEENAAIIDGTLTYNSNGPFEFYGKPIIDLTVGQYLYYMLLRQAYTTCVESTKRVTKTWLKKMKKESQ
jgi:hypothetical protein